MPKLTYHGTPNSLTLGLTGKEIDYLSRVGGEEATRMLREVGFHLFTETDAIDGVELYNASFRTGAVELVEGSIELPGREVWAGYEDARKLRSLLAQAANIREHYPGIHEGVNV